MPSPFLHAICQDRPHRCTQILATFVVSLGPLATGIGKGYSSPALASLLNHTNTTSGENFHVTPEEGSWIASLSLLGAVCGGLPSGLAMQLGRKRVLLFVSLPFTLFWLITVFANCVQMIYISSFLCGVCSAIISLVTPVYISEIAVPEIRGTLCSIAKIAANIGMLLSYFLGVYLDWRKLALVASVVPALLFASVTFIPETPSFLLYKHREHDAENSLEWLRRSQDVTQEFDTIKENIKRIEEREKFSCHKDLNVALIKPLLVTCGLMAFQKFSGANAFNFYAVPILSQVFVWVDPYSAAVVVGVLQILAGLLSSFLIDTVGRLPLLIMSNILMTFALGGFGTYIYIHNGESWDNRGIDWIPFTCALIFQVAYSLGISPISWLYIGELFPLKHRGLGAIANSVSYACSFASVKTFVDFQLLLGLHGSFWLYAVIALVGLVFIVLLVPETNGKGLEEMEQMCYAPPERYTPIYDRPTNAV